MFVKEKEMLIY